MKILKDNYSTKEEIEVKKYPRIITCEHCYSELEYDDTDMHEGALGLMYIDCPLCNGETMIEDEDGVVLTKSNVEFPTHFYHTSVETGAVDCLKNGEIKEYINKGIDFFRANKEEFCWWTATGNLTLFVVKMDGEEEYWVFATGDYYETHIPFQSEDY